MTDPLPLAEAVRRACIEVALSAYEDAGVAGLCAEGRWEAAVSAMQSLDLKRVPGDGEAAGSTSSGSGNTP